MEHIDHNYLDWFDEYNCSSNYSYKTGLNRWEKLGMQNCKRLTSGLCLLYFDWKMMAITFWRSSTERKIYLPYLLFFQNWILFLPFELCLCPITYCYWVCRELAKIHCKSVLNLPVKKTSARVLIFCNTTISYYNSKSRLIRIILMNLVDSQLSSRNSKKFEKWGRCRYFCKYEHILLKLKFWVGKVAWANFFLNTRSIFNAMLPLLLYFTSN